METKEIRIIKLGPMQVASAYAFGNSPEEAALEKMHRFIRENNLLVDGQMPPTFGINNQNP